MKHRPLCLRQTRRRNRHPYAVKIIGLTGSIGMGKSTAARMIKCMGIAVFDADATTHRLMGPKGTALPHIEERFPGIVGSQGVDRKRLGDIVFKDKAALNDLEAILHPMIGQEKESFLKRHALRRSGRVVLDVPLLFETDGQNRCDAVLVVTTPKFLQRQRVLARVGMTDEKLAGILSHQMPDQYKRRLATAVVTSGLGIAVTWRKLRQVLVSDLRVIGKVG
jgi:dephospho-CoA kinase